MKTSFAAIALAAALPVSGAQIPASAEAFLSCADVADAAARLQCFDRAAAAVRAAVPPAPTGAMTPGAPASSTARQVSPTAAPVTSSPSPDIPARTTSPPASTPSLGEEQLRGKKQRDTEPEALQARITESRSEGGGRYLLFLDNGQVWRHEMGSMSAYLLVGEAVTIRKASLGSYRLTLDDGKSKNWVRVTRVR